MKYIVRAIKYFFTLTIVLCLMLFVMVKLKLVNGDISTMFIHGYDSLWQMALIVAAFAAVYPSVGYGKRTVTVPGSDEELRPVLDGMMEARGYRIEKEDRETIRFVKKSPVARALKMWEDGISVTRLIDGFVFEGRTKDVVRVVSAFEAKISRVD